VLRIINEEIKCFTAFAIFKSGFHPWDSECCAGDNQCMSFEKSHNLINACRILILSWDPFPARF
jgi:hypothetical protein